MPLINCAWCGNLKKIRPFEVPIQRFCSRKCRGLMQSLSPNKGSFKPGNPYRFKLGNEFGIEYRFTAKSEGNARETT